MKPAPQHEKERVLPKKWVKRAGMFVVTTFRGNKQEQEWIAPEPKKP